MVIISLFYPFKKKEKKKKKGKTKSIFYMNFYKPGKLIQVKINMCGEGEAK